MNRILMLTACLIALLGTISLADAPKDFSGIYPQLATFNNEGECGTGAVVPWAGRLWVISYGPHKPFGSSDKLYEITPDLKQIIHPESIGGTPANRMIHKETEQLIIGPYVIDKDGKVRVISWKQMPGRLTGNARHLTDPANKIYYATMEQGLYEVDLHTLAVTGLIRDQNKPTPGSTSEVHPAQLPANLPGYHGKGLYSSQGRVVYGQNGDHDKRATTDPTIPSGALGEFTGQGAWHLIRRNQFTEVTGPGGIFGNPNPDKDPIWAVGWDYRSLILDILEDGKWHSFRLPKASHSYDGAHGWNTEWPRIRDVGPEGKPDLLMTMHGMFWHFPMTFSTANSSGIRPRGAYLKVIGDFCRWNDRLVFGCDDNAMSAFLNSRKLDGKILGPGQSQSNLWFTSPDQPDHLGPVGADGALWLHDAVKDGDISDPMLFAGWEHRTAYFTNDGDQPITCTLEFDADGKGQWTQQREVKLPAKSAVVQSFDPSDKSEWIRVKITGQSSSLSVQFIYAGTETRTAAQPPALFDGLAKISAPPASSTGGLIRALTDNRRTMGLATADAFYELTADMKLLRRDDEVKRTAILKKMAIPKDAVMVDESSILIVDDRHRRWRFPKGDPAFDQPTRDGQLRICREVSTERDLMDLHGTFYELPAENADGFMHVRPIASHNFAINEFGGYRGFLIMTGINTEAGKNNALNPHIIVSDDHKAAVWAGAIDDLWQLGKPTGHGGPWHNTSVELNQPSDPYLFGFYDQRKLTLTNSGQTPVTIKVELDPGGVGPWVLYQEFKVDAGGKVEHDFPAGLSARWIRFTSDQSSKVTAELEYR